MKCVDHVSQTVAALFNQLSTYGNVEGSGFIFFVYSDMEQRMHHDVYARWQQIGGGGDWHFRGVGGAGAKYVIRVYSWQFPSILW